MSVVVKGMEMPDSCAVCRFAGRGGYFMERIVCMFTGENEDAENVDRLPECPLIALHGRLVDANARGKLSKSAVWNKLSKVYNMKGLPDEAYSIIGDVMLGLQVEDAQNDQPGA